jgi:lipopolysaccharide export system protein LptA
VAVGTSPPAAPAVAETPPSAAPVEAASPSRKQTEGGGKQVASKEPTPAHGPFGDAFSGGGKGPIDIKSDTLSLDYTHKSVLFSGHVHAVQTGGTLTSDKLKVNYGENFHDVQEMIADGNVRISQGTQYATGDHAVMENAQHTVVLTGSPIVHDGQDQITGTKITVHLDTGQSVVAHGHAVLFPKGKNEEKGAADGAVPADSTAP